MSVFYGSRLSRHGIFHKENCLLEKCNSKLQLFKYKIFDSVPSWVFVILLLKRFVQALLLAWVSTRLTVTGRKLSSLYYSLFTSELYRSVVKAQ